MTSKIMASSGGWRVHPADEMNISAISYGGPGMSTMANSEIIEPSRLRSTTLQDAKWSDMRKKVGIPRYPKEKTQESDMDQKIANLARFIRQNFHEKECKSFVPKPNQSKESSFKALKCHCGETLSNHDGLKLNSMKDLSSSFLIPNELKPYARRDDGSLPEKLPQWNKNEHISKRVTKSFGKISFKVEQIGGRKPSKYIRVSDDDDERKVLDMMTDYWRIMEPKAPNLVISVVGGAKNFKLDGRMRETFSTGLIKAAKTTSAWLITSGFNMGVMKAVGQAVHEGQTFLWDDDRMTHLLRCIAIAPWGYVRGRDCLMGDENNTTGKYNASYKPSNVILHGKPVPLNPDHTHFIFVDDGFRNRYGGVSDFRAKFERLVSTPQSEGGIGVPVVLIVVEGGTDAIQDAKRSLDKHTPVVVCAGTGRAADILAYAYKHTAGKGDKRHIKRKYKRKLRNVIVEYYGKNWKDNAEEETEKYLDLVEDCCKREDLMIIFHMNKHEDLDLAILSVLLKAKKDGNKLNNISERLDKLKLALTWNRADIAQREIFAEDVNWKSGDLDDVMTIAILEDKVDFVKLLLNQGVAMKEYLTVKRLEDLYNKIPKHSHLYLLLFRANNCKPNFELPDIGRFLKSLLDRFDDEQFQYKTTRKTSLNIHDYSDDKDDDGAFMCPYKQLLIWSVLMNRSQMSTFFWEMGQEPITSAIAATRLCDGMIYKLPKYQNDLREEFSAAKNLFEELAIKVLDECQSVDPDKSMMLVERKSPMWSSMTCLQMAASAEDQVFLSSVGCQYAINHTWKRGILSSWRRVLVTVLFPFLLLSGFMELSDLGEQKIDWFVKMKIFYTAPITKFTFHTFSYLIFLGLYSYMVLVDYKLIPSVSEWICFLWILTFLAGEIHVFFAFPSPTLWGKIRDWYGFLNRLDLINLTFAIIAFILRWEPAYFHITKTIYCINAVIFYIRLLRYYIANRSLGPKLFMILKMCEELLMFCFVLIIFLLAYGVASQGLMYKTRPAGDFNIVVDIFYYPYWQLYGELFLEEIQTDETCVAALPNTTSLSDPSNTCRTYNILVPILLAGYLLVGNVLLLNLLIAIFSHVFDTVEKKSLEIWKFQMYFLVSEYDVATGFVPPFSIIAHAYFLLKWVFRSTCCAKQQEGVQFQPHHLVYLKLFEKEMMANFLRRRKAGEMNSLDMRFNTLQKRVDDLSKLIEDEMIAGDESDDDYQPLEHQDTIIPADTRSKWPEVEDVLELQKTEKILDNLIGEDSKAEEPVSQKFEDIAMEEVKKKHKKKKKKKDKKKREKNEEHFQENLLTESMDLKPSSHKSLEDSELPLNLSPYSPVRNINPLSSPRSQFSPKRNVRPLLSHIAESESDDDQERIPRDKLGRRLSNNIKSRASFLELSESSEEDNLSSRGIRGSRKKQKKRRQQEYNERLMDVEDRMGEIVRSNQEALHSMQYMLEKHLKG